MTAHRPITITGHGDDTITIDRDGDSHDIDAYGGADIILRDPTTGDSLVITSHYSRWGAWALGVTLLEDADTLPGWDIVIDNGHPESPALTVHAPTGTTITSG